MSVERSATLAQSTTRGNLVLQSNLACNPSSPWQVDVTWSGSSALSSLPCSEYIEIFTFVRSEALSLRDFLHSNSPDLEVGRIGMIYDGLGTSIRLVPLTGTDLDEWKPILASSTRFDEQDQGFVDTKSGPRVNAAKLCEWKKELRGDDEDDDDYTFQGDGDDSLFARIVQGKEEQWRVYQDANTVAILTPFANCPYTTVLVPRSHLSSDIFSLSLSEYTILIKSTFEALRIFDRVKGQQGVAIAMEGLEIDYAHVKLYPRFGPNQKHKEEYMPSYQGFLTSKPGPSLSASQVEADSRRIVEWRHK